MRRGTSILENARQRIRSLPRERFLEITGIAAVVIIAAALRFSNLGVLGYVNHYYTAGVKSMLQSWHNFFFAAAEPGGSVSLDKPPLGLWLEALSAYIFGVNGFGVLLPELLAGTLSVLVIYHLVRRSFGVIPGLLAALALAITPAAVATDRNNTVDSTLIFTLLLAAWAFIKATETGRLRYLLLGAFVVAVGFNIKMLQAYMLLPAFYALYFLGSPEKIWQKVGKLLLASALLVMISLPWVVAVDRTPADQRPYVGSSSDNSETNLILVYNGLGRLLGMFGRRGNVITATPSFLNGGNSIDAGKPGWLRLLRPPLNKETGWLLPFGLVSMILLAFGSRWQWPIAWKHQALALWGIWLLTCVVFFSIASFFHPYYLLMLAPPLAALTGIGLDQLWRLAGTRPWLSLTALAALVAGTIAFQIHTAQQYIYSIWWLPEVVVLLVAGLAISSFTAMVRKGSVPLAFGFGLITAAMLVTPGAWSVLTNLSASQNQSLPASYSGGRIGPVVLGDLRVDQSLLDYLQSHTQGMKYLMAVPSSMQGADYVLATGRPVLYIGGFLGSDHVVTANDLAQLVRNHELRYIYWSTGSRGIGSNRDLSPWLASACKRVPGFTTLAQNFGAPDGFGANSSGLVPGLNNSTTPNRAGVGGIIQVALYDCATP